MKRMLPWFAAAALLSPLTAQARDETSVFRPTGNWTADYGDDYCRLIRTFTDGRRELGLALERLQPGAEVRLIVVGEGLRPFQGADEIGYRFQGGNSGEARFARSETADGQPYFSLDSVSLAPSPAFTAPVRDAAYSPPPMYSRADEQAAARAITGLMLTEGLVSPVQVETGSLGAPVEALQACADDLLAVWGLDAEKHKSMTAAAMLNPNPDGVLPPGAIRLNELNRLRGGGLQHRQVVGGGANEVRLLVGADGSVTECAIVSPSLAQSVNDRICSLATERASFQPARDVAGQPMASVWIGSPMSLAPSTRATRAGQVWSLPEPRQIPIPDVPPVVINVPPWAFGSAPPGS